jgi:hypothetical protein
MAAVRNCMGCYQQGLLCGNLWTNKKDILHAPCTA